MKHRDFKHEIVIQSVKSKKVSRKNNFKIRVTRSVHLLLIFEKNETQMLK